MFFLQDTRYLRRLVRQMRGSLQVYLADKIEHVRRANRTCSFHLGTWRRLSFQTCELGVERRRGGHCNTAHTHMDAREV